MRCKQTIILGSLLSVSLVAVSCSQIANTGRKKTGAASHYLITNESFDTNACTRGMFILTAQKDLFKREFSTQGRGFISKKQIENPDPYTRLGYRPIDPKKGSPPDVAMNIGPSIQIDLGTQNVASADVATSEEYSMVLNAMKSTAQTDLVSDKLVLSWRPDWKAYYSDYGSKPGRTIEASTLAPYAYAQNEDGVQEKAAAISQVKQVRSFVFGLSSQQTVIGANIPESVETEENEKGLSGVIADNETLDIPIAASPSLAGKEGLILVTIEEYKEKPTWRAYYSVKDSSGEAQTLSIPTKGKNYEGKDFELGAGPAKIVISRWLMTHHPVNDNVQGTLCVASGNVLVTYGELEGK